jgi:hypothetical protein
MISYLLRINKNSEKPSKPLLCLTLHCIPHDKNANISGYSDHTSTQDQEDSYKRRWQTGNTKDARKRKRKTARAKVNAAAKRAKPFAPVLNTDPVDKVAKAAPKKVVGGNKNKRKQTTPARARLVTLGSGEHTKQNKN